MRARPRGGWVVVVVARGAAVWSAKARTVAQVRTALDRAARRRRRELAA
jgi:hypothetical protein